jgi:hypothetical protein
MTAIGGANHDGASRLVVVDPTPEPQAAGVTPAVRRLRSASLNDQWHILLDGVYAHLGDPR